MLRPDPAMEGGSIGDTLRTVVDLLSNGPDDRATRTALSLLQGLEAELPPSPPVALARPAIQGFDAAQLSARVDKALRDRQAEQQPCERPDSFRWESDAAGIIHWVEGVPRAALIGRSIPAAEHGGTSLRSAFRDAPFMVAGEGAASGDWLLSGVPFFDSAEGRFRGFRGSARRDQDAQRGAIALDSADDPDLVRQLVHELRTPLNAILGFAGLIEGEFLGPADQAYRERAARIGEEAQRVLTAVEEMDRQARSRSET